MATWNNNDPNLSVTYLQKIAIVCQTIHGQLHIPIILLCQLYVAPQMTREFIVMLILISQSPNSFSQMSWYAKLSQHLWTDIEYSSCVPEVKTPFIFSITDQPLKTDLLYNQLTPMLLIYCICFCWTHLLVLTELIFKIILFNSGILGEKLHYPWCNTVKKIPPIRESQPANHAKQAL